METHFAINEVNPASNIRIMTHGPNTLHRHDYQQVLVLTKGVGVHHIDGEVHEVHPPWAMLVPKGKVHLFVPKMGAQGWCIDFSEEFLPLDPTSTFSSFFEQANVPLGEGLLLEQATALSRLLQATADGAEPGPTPVLRYLLSALLELLQAESRQLARWNRPHRASDHQLVSEFMRHLDQSFFTEKEVGFYTRQLRVTSKRLSAACKASLGKTPQVLITERCMLEAKRRLLYGEDSIQQLGCDLGYDAPSHFSRVFKKVTGETPSSFRASRAHL